MAFTAYIGSGQGVAKYNASGLPGGSPALQSVNCLEACRLRVAFTRAMDFSHPALLEPSNYHYSFGGDYYPVLCCLQVDAQTVDLIVPIIKEIILSATAHLKVLEGRDPRGIALDAVLNETDFTALGVVWASSPTHLTALMGTVEGLEVDDLPSNWLGSSATLLLTKRKTMKIQFQSTEKLRVRLPPFLNKNDWSYIMGTDAATLYIKCPDGTVLQTGVGGVPTPTYDTDVRMWSVDLDVSYYTDHHHTSTNEWKVYAVSNDANYVPQWASYFWGDYVDDVTTAKTSAGSADTKLGTPAVTVSADVAAVKGDTAAIKLRTDGLPDDPADESLLEAAIAGVQGDVTTIDTKLGTPVASVSEDIASVQSDTTAIDGNVDTILTRIGTPASDLATQLAALGTDVTLLKKIGTGRWRVTTGNQFIIYDTDGVTPLLRFNLKDLVGLPTSDNIYERTPA